SAWFASRGWDSPPARRSARRARATCAGASLRARNGWPKEWLACGAPWKREPETTGHRAGLVPPPAPLRVPLGGGCFFPKLLLARLRFFGDLPPQQPYPLDLPG